MQDGPHQNEHLAARGADLQQARTAMVMVHGRGDSAEGILSLAPFFEHPGVAYLAPQAARNTWYPHPFMVDWQENEPGISSGLKAIDEVVARITEAGISHQQIVLLGFSQGACLTSEYAARNPRRYGGVVVLTGGLIGASVDPERYTGSFEGTPILLGCSDVDPHIPVERVDVTEQVMQRLQGQVDKRIYPGMGHTVNEDEIGYIQQLLSQLNNQT